MINILELEQKLKDQLELDKSDPMTYQYLKDLIEGILTVKRYKDNAMDIDIISHEMATEFYFKLNNPNKEFRLYAPTKYLIKSIHRFIDSYNWWNVHKTEIEVPDLIDLYDFQLRMYPSLVDKDLGSIEDTIREIPIFISKFYDDHIRYYKDSDEYKHTKIALLLSIYNQQITLYESCDERLLRVFYKMIMDRLPKWILEESRYNEYFDLDHIKLFELSIGGEE